MRTGTLLLCGMLTAWTLVACSEEDGGGGALSGASAGDQKSLLAMSDAEAVDLCQRWRDDYRTTLSSEQAFCTEQAAEVGVEPAICRENARRCIDDGRYREELEDDWDCASAVASDFVDVTEGACTASVGEWRACMEVQLTQYRAAVAAASCDGPSSADFEERLPAECETLLGKCPGIDI